MNEDDDIPPPPRRKLPPVPDEEELPLPPKPKGPKQFVIRDTAGSYVHSFTKGTELQGDRHVQPTKTQPNWTKKLAEAMRFESAEKANAAGSYIAGLAMRKLTLRIEQV